MVDAISLTTAKKYLTREPGAELKISKATYESYFVIRSLEHADCDQFQTAALFEGSSCTDPVDGSLFYIDSLTKDFFVNTITPIDQIEICLKISSVGQVYQF